MSTSTDVRQPRPGRTLVTTSVNLPPETHAELRRLAKAKDRPLAYLVREAVDLWLATHRVADRWEGAADDES